jgi:periplasmic protein TonB
MEITSLRKKRMKIQWKNNWENPSAQDRLDLVFENRFTDYGAYDLRRKSSKNQVLAMAIAFLGVGLLVSLPRLFAKSSLLILPDVPPTMDTTKCYIPIFPLEPAAPKTNGGGGSNKNSGVPIFDPMVPMMPTSPTIPFGYGSGNEQSDPGDIPNSNNGPSNKGEDTAASTFHSVPDSECEFRGGLEAFTTYIKENFNTPNTCSDGLEGYAMVRFCVNIDGHISNVEIVENSRSCPTFGEEVKRVVEMSPNWKAATRRGKYMKCWRQVPVRLRLE